jgi:peptide/nickel transport system ATP-binding protein
MRLLPSPAGRICGGQVWFTPAPNDPPTDLVTASERTLQSIRGNRIAMVFQDPMTALNPVFTVGRQIAEVVDRHHRTGRRAASGRAVELLERVGIADPHRRAHDYPHRLSGGMRQRVMIAMALAGHPDVLIADEPTTALDVTVQAQILDLLGELQAADGMSVLLITHDLAVVARAADAACVMYAGRVVERAAVTELFDNPLHPYTRGLLRCMPSGTVRGARFDAIPGVVADLADVPAGCRFHPRCAVSARRASGDSQAARVVNDAGQRAVVLRRCVDGEASDPGAGPPLREVRPGHDVACWEV